MSSRNKYLKINIFTHMKRKKYSVTDETTKTFNVRQKTITINVQVRPTSVNQNILFEWINSSARKIS